MLNENYKSVANAVKGINAKGRSMWAALVAFTLESNTNGHESLKDNFKAQEKLALGEMKLEMGKNSTYKVAKGVLVRATEYGVAITDPKGKPRGKTDIEKELAALKGEKSPADKFKVAMTTANTIADKLLDTDCPTAAALVSDLYAKIAARMPMLKAA